MIVLKNISNTKHRICENMFFKRVEFEIGKINLYKIPFARGFKFCKESQSIYLQEQREMNFFLKSQPKWLLKAWFVSNHGAQQCCESHLDYLDRISILATIQIYFQHFSIMIAIIFSLLKLSSQMNERATWFQRLYFSIVIKRKG